MLNQQDIKFWELKITEEEFNRMKNHDDFVPLIQLCRIVNTMMFFLDLSEQAQTTERMEKEQYGEVKPATIRQNVHSLFFLSSILFEGLQIVPGLNQNFSELAAFKILKDFTKSPKNRSSPQTKLLPDVTPKSPLWCVLVRIRNRVMFHFDGTAISTALEDFSHTNHIFASAFGRQAGYMYYVLADELVVNYALDTKTS